MEYIAIISTVSVIHILAVISPGPDFIVAVKHSLSYSRKTGIWTAFGFGAGITIHVLYCVAGLAVLISQSIIIFNIVKYLGAAYLIYIGIKSIISKTSNVEVEAQKKKEYISNFKALKIGFFTNVLNPKATLFFLSIFTMVISPDTPKSIIAILSFIMIFNTILWFSLVSIFFTQKRIIKIYSKFQKVFNKIFGALLIAIGIKVAFLQS